MQNPKFKQKTCQENQRILTASFRKSELGGRRLGALTLSEVKCSNLLSERNTASKSNSLDFSVPVSDFVGAEVSLLFFAFSCLSGGEGLVGLSVGSSLMGSLFNEPVLPKNDKNREMKNRIEMLLVNFDLALQKNCQKLK